MARPPIAIAISFIDAINRRDLASLDALMTEDHALVVFDEPPLEGRAANMDAWDGYLTSYPNYIIHPYTFGVDGTQVAIVGTTTGSHLGLPDEDEMSEMLVWLADVRGDKLARWTLVADTPERRRVFDLPPSAQ